MSFNFAIVGGGLTGTTMLYQIVEKLRQNRDLIKLSPSGFKIQIFEKQETFGPGFPHSDRNVMPFHITNMCANDMGILPGNPADFQEWVTRHQNDLKALFPYLDDVSHSSGHCSHYPRAIMGAYLKERFQEAYQKARALSLNLELYPQSEVVDLEDRGDNVHLTVKNILTGSNFSCTADRVLLATGHWFEKKEQNNYFSSPWPAKNLLSGIPEGEKVAVIGTSLSAIEVVLTLTSNGHFERDDSGKLVYVTPSNPRRFTLYSRRGLLPKVRGRMGKYRNRFLTRKKLEGLIAEKQGYLTLEAVFQLLNSELEAAYGHSIDWKTVMSPTGPPTGLLRQYLEDAIQGDGPDGELVWQTVLHQSFDMVREIYLRLSLEDRELFDQTYTSVFFTHAATQPAINAEKMLALMESGIVEVIKLGRNYQFARTDTKDGWEFIYQDNNGETKKDAYRFVVDARGQAKSIQTDPSPLTKNLLSRGIVQIEEAQLVQQENRQGKPSARDQKVKLSTNKTGSIWIDPETHHVMRQVSGKIPTRSKAIYAVGAMTRGQIIDASMAHGIVQSTARIADSWIDDLKRVKM